MATIGNPREPNQPSRFELASRLWNMQLTYSTTNIDGQPQLDYQDQQRNITYTGDEISSLESEIGMMITVFLDANPDSWTLTLTLLLPQINLKEGTDESSFSTLAVLTTHHTSIGGPPLVRGPLQTYAVVALEGTARLVAS
jgi:hypothetical protein